MRDDTAASDKPFHTLWWLYTEVGNIQQEQKEEEEHKPLLINLQKIHVEEK